VCVHGGRSSTVVLVAVVVVVAAVVLVRVVVLVSVVAPLSAAMPCFVARARRVHDRLQWHRARRDLLLALCEGQR
jgi:uncharacterized protein HemY